MKRYKAFILLVGTTLLSNCTSKHDASVKSAVSSSRSSAELSLNDIAILFPAKQVLKNHLSLFAKPNPAVFAPGLPHLSTDDGLGFIPDDAMEKIDQVIASSLIGDQKTLVDSNFFRDVKSPGDDSPTAGTETLAVALRLDPCSNAFAVGSDLDKCQPQLRILWQANQNLGFSDANFHTSYNLTTSEFSEVLATIRTLKAAPGVPNYDQEPVQPHPAMVAQGDDSAFGKGIIGIIHRYARVANLSAISALADTNGGGDGFWPMVSLTVNNGVMTPFPVPGVSTSNPVETMVGDGALLEIPNLLSTNSNSMFFGFKPASGSGATLVRPVFPSSQSVLEGTFKSANPKLTDVSTLDCASCHRVRSSRENVENAASLTVPVAAKFTSHWPLTNSSDNPQHQIDGTFLQMLSYEPRTEDQFIVAERLINEAAVSADLINQFSSESK